MNNFERFHNILDQYLKNNAVPMDILTDLHRASINDANKEDIRYVYNGEKDLVVIEWMQSRKKDISKSNKQRE